MKIYKPDASRKSNYKTSHRVKPTVLILAFWILFFGGFIIKNFVEDRRTELARLNATATPEVSLKPERTYHVLPPPTSAPLPADGQLYKSYDRSSSGNSVLKINLPDSNDYYYIKLVDSSGNMVQSIFMYPKTSHEFGVPCGSYTLKYAFGSTWLGEEKLFGPKGGYCESDNAVEFTHQYGSEITLTASIIGNFSTSGIDYKSF